MELNKIGNCLDFWGGIEFKKETVLWFLINSEDVGDMLNMVVLAMLVGFGVTGVMLYMFTYENIRQYAVIKAMGASNKQLHSSEKQSQVPISLFE